MSYFPCDIPFMSDDELKENGIYIPKDGTDTNVRNTEHIRKSDAVDAVPKERVVEYMDEFSAGYNSCRNDMLRSIESLEPADVAPVVHGRWIEEWWHGDKTRKCSVCNLTQIVNVYKGEVKFNYCPYCGAKMDREE